MAVRFCGEKIYTAIQLAVYIVAHVVGGVGLVGPGGVGGNGPLGFSPPGSSTLFIFVVFSLKIFAYT